MKYTVFIFLIFSSNLLAQTFQDDFSDGDFTNNPTWLGNTNIFIVNASNEVQLNDVAGGTAQLYAPVAISDSTVWEFYFRLEFSPSTSNQLRVYLMSDNSDFTASLNGYFLQVGESGSTDAIELYRQTGTSNQLLLRATNGGVAADPAEARVRITRDNSGNWELLTDYSNGTNYSSEGTFFDNTYTTGTYFGWHCAYTSTRKDKFFFDDIRISPLFTDINPPAMNTITATGANTIDVQFNEPITASSAQQNSNYSVSSIGNPTSAVLDGADPSLVHLTLPSNLSDGQNYTLTVSNISDINGNILASANQNFVFYNVQIAVAEDVVINEILADPTPSVGLPEVEFVELYNRSSKTLALSDLIFYNSSNAFPLPNRLFLAGEYLIICDVSDTADLSNFGNVIGINGFSALSNAGDDLAIQNTNGDVIHAVNYTDNWYGDPTKSDGGYTLELINPSLVCIGASNWQASNHPNGGTPGQQNSVFDNTPDTDAPQVMSVVPSSNNTVVVAFDEFFDENTALQTANYIITNGIGNPQNVTLVNAQTVELTFTTTFTNATSYSLETNGVADCSGNSMSNSMEAFTYYDVIPASAYDILITEIYADPSPSLGLPEVEYVELYNRATTAINLKDFVLETNSSSTVLTNYILLPNEYVVLHQENFLIDFSLYQNRLGLADFPALGNTSEQLKLYNLNGELIYFVNYTSAWYGDSDKANGGRSLEMISLRNYCLDAKNWTASTATQGGTPGAENAVHQSILDEMPPLAERAFPFSNTIVEVFFNERLDENSASDALNFTFSNNIAVIDAAINPDHFNSIILTLGAPLAENEIYFITINTSLTDCQGNAITTPQIVKVALPQPIEAFDLVINEILFNPETGGFDFLELYNRSGRVFNLADLKIGNIDNGQLGAFSEIEKDYLIFPTELVLISENILDIQSRYLDNLLEQPILGTFVENDLPTFPDAEGGVMLLNQNGELIDRLDYSDDWHHPLLIDTDGVSLERINPNENINDQNNWHSAAATVGYATPSYENSQRAIYTASANETVSIPKKTFSPDDDGFDDFLLIYYQLAENDYSATIMIYSSNGELVKQLAQNQLFGRQGVIKWDGTTDDGTKARMGIYIVFLEFTRPDGTVSRMKKTCVLAARL